MKLQNLAFLAPLVGGSSLEANPASTSQDAVVSYDGYKVYSIPFSSAHEFRGLESRLSRYHVQPIRNALSVAIPPSEVADFESLGLNTRLVNPDLGAYIRSTENKPALYNRGLHKRGALPDLSWFDAYHPYADHLAYWDDLVAAFPNNSKKFELGTSYENRTIFAYHLFGNENSGNENQSEKPVILWHATVHAREVC